MAEKQYAERDAFALDKAGGYYMRHVQAMTAEGLHGKGDIAAELGHRDHRIDVLEKLLASAKRMAEFGDINADMEDDGIGWKQWYLDVSAILPPKSPSDGDGKRE